MAEAPNSQSHHSTVREQRAMSVLLLRDPYHLRVRDFGRGMALPCGQSGNPTDRARLLAESVSCHWMLAVAGVVPPDTLQ